MICEPTTDGRSVWLSQAHYAMTGDAWFFSTDAFQATAIEWLARESRPLTIKFDNNYWLVRTTNGHVYEKHLPTALAKVILAITQQRNA